MVTDAEGAVKELIEYEPWGSFAVHEKYGDDQDTAWYYFTGKPLDDETGLYYYGRRYYDPHIGRFLSEDPLGLVSVNAYSYAANNPVNLTDPLGLLQRKIAFIPNPAWSLTRDKVKEELTNRFGSRFSEQELNFFAEKFADKALLEELGPLQDPKTKGETSQNIAQRIKEEIEKTGNPQQKDLVKRLEEAIKEEAEKGKGDTQCPTK